jgi:glucose/arabinose dehydrogenase
MIKIRARRHGFVALWLSATMLLAAGTSAVTLGAKDKASPEPSAAVATSPEPSAEFTPEPSAEPTPEPTPFPTFDPSTVSVRTDLFVEGLNAPVYLTDDGTGARCMYVVERGGIVRIVEDGGFVRPKPFLNISGLVATGPEQGLHAIAFHPGFKKNRRFFVHYNAVLDGSSVIAEFRARPCKPASNKPVKTLLTVEQPFPNNNAGWIGFGPDGYLYVPLGDGGGVSPGDPNGYGQAKSTRLSKVLRMDVNKGKAYGIPKDNPFAKKKQGFPRETWAMGLRDPRRASFDRKTGDLWIGDVGQDRIEEVNRIPAGVSKLNFGWSDVEGASICHPNVPDCDPSLYEPPVHSYDQVPPHRAITGGYVYRGEAVPALDGVYLFSDFSSGFIWGLDAEAVAAGAPATARMLLDAPQGFVSFGEDDAGELYVISLDGSVYRIGAE